MSTSNRVGPPPASFDVNAGAKEELGRPKLPSALYFAATAFLGFNLLLLLFETVVLPALPTIQTERREREEKERAARRLAALQTEHEQAAREISALEAAMALLEQEFADGIGVSLAESTSGKMPPAADAALLKHESIKSLWAAVETTWNQGRQELQTRERLREITSRLSSGQPDVHDEELLRSIITNAHAMVERVHEARLKLDSIVNVVKIEELASATGESP